MFFKALLPSAFLATALFGRATAQFFHTSSVAPVSTATADACILSCVESVATASGSGCSSATDISCICSSTSVQSNIASCVLKQCPSSDLAAAQALQSQECAAVSISMPSSSVTETSSIPFSAATASSSATPNVSSNPASSSSETLLSASSASSAASSAERSSSSAAGTSASANASIKAGGGELYGGAMGIVVALIGAVAGAGLVM